MWFFYELFPWELNNAYSDQACAASQCLQNVVTNLTADLSLATIKMIAGKLFNSNLGGLSTWIYSRLNFWLAFLGHIHKICVTWISPSGLWHLRQTFFFSIPVYPEPNLRPEVPFLWLRFTWILHPMWNIFVYTSFMQQSYFDFCLVIPLYFCGYWVADSRLPGIIRNHQVSKWFIFCPYETSLLVYFH